MRRLLAIAVAVALGSAAASASSPSTPTARNVIVITLDGVRWQELFGGPERSMLGRDEKEIVESASYKRFWRPAPEERRAALMPFFWTVVARQGQVFGDPSRGSLAHVTNGLWFSYPGYSEMFAGVADPRVDSNDKVLNPNVTVLEWLNSMPAYRGRVAAFGGWDVLSSIVAASRGRIPVGEGALPVPVPKSGRERWINEMMGDLPRLWNGNQVDAPYMQAAMECLQTRRPRVLYVMLGETDEWAHERRYDRYLDAIYRGDRFIRRVWETVQRMPGYANATAIVLATDHGRGAGNADWTDHGRKVPAAERTWIAVMGPGTPALGVRESVSVSAAQVGATIAALLGEDFSRAVTAAAPPLPGIRPGRPAAPGR
jgi:hypothetical protein